LEYLVIQFAILKTATKHMIVHLVLISAERFVRLLLSTCIKSRQHKC